MSQAHNEKLVEEFIQHLKLGKPIQRLKKKPIGEKTAKKNTTWLHKISEWLDHKPFEKVTEKDIDTFRTKLANDTIKQRNGKPYAKSVKRDIEYKILGCFYKWLGKPELIYYTDQYNEQKETPALTRQEIETMIQSSRLRDKVILAVMYDSGARAAEFLNLTYADIKDEERKSKGYYKIRITKSKTKPRTISLMMDFTTEILDNWLKANKDKIGTNQPLVNITHPLMGMTIRNIGKATINKHVWPHLLRHSSATWYCHKLNQYQMNKRYGWSMNSRMAAVYIDREGVQEEESNSKILDEEALTYRKEVNRLKEEVAIGQQAREEMSREMAELKKYVEAFGLVQNRKGSAR